MAEIDLSEPWGRMKWARIRAGFEQAKDAALLLEIPEATYRSYERPTESQGRWPKIARLQKIAKRFGVSWLWLQDGKGDPEAPPGQTSDADLERLVEASKVVDISKRHDAINAAVSVLESFRAKKA